MKININNYESYFLLYIDNELSIEDRKLVEGFVAQNPALREEFELLQGTVLPVNEEICFDRESLYKSLTNPLQLQEMMLLHLDNELEPADENELVKKIAAEESLQSDWSLLQKTKLDADDVIAFPGKSNLYKKEPTRIVSLAFVKWAAAAAVIAAGIYWGVNFNGAVSVNTNEVANNNAGKIAKPGMQNTITEETTPAQKNNNSGTEVTAKIKEDKKIIDKDSPVHNPAENNLALTNKKQDRKVQKTNPDQVFDNTQPVLANVDTRDVTGISKPEISMLNIKKTSTDKTDLLAAMTAKDKPKNLAENTDKNIIPVSNSYASVASLNETPNDDHIFLMDQDKLADSKAGIFLKKLKRTVTRTTNISPGKTLKIAGFEFAVK